MVLTAGRFYCPSIWRLNVEHRCDEMPDLASIRWDWHNKVWLLHDGAAKIFESWREVTECPYCGETLPSGEPERPDAEAK